MSAKFWFRTVLNTLYHVTFVTFSLRISQSLKANLFENYQLSTADHINIGLYIAPFGSVFLGFSLYIAFVLYQEPASRPRVHPAALILPAGNVLFCNPMHYGRGGRFHSVVEQFSEINIIFMIINIFLAFVVTAIISLFLPLMITCGQYSNDSSVSALALIIQIPIIFVTSIFYFICFNQYGYYSLIIVLSAIFYCVVAIVYYIIAWASFLSSVTSMFHIIFETITIIVMFTIVFHVKYNNLTLSIMVIYFVVNIPFIKLLLWDRYRNITTVNIGHLLCLKMWIMVMKIKYIVYYMMNYMVKMQKKHPLQSQHHYYRYLICQKGIIN